MFKLIKLSFLFSKCSKTYNIFSLLNVCSISSLSQVESGDKSAQRRCRYYGRQYSGNSVYCRLIHTSRTVSEKKTSAETAVMRFHDFDHAAEKDRQTYLELIRLYEGRHPQRRGHVEFIYVAMKHMTDFGVDKDLQIYKALLNVLPKGRFIPTNLFQVEFMHYPKQQQCAIDLLEKLEDNGIMPDAEMETILINIFGTKGHPVRKYWRMMYWMPKFINLSPWPVPKPPPRNLLDLARLAIERICSVDLQAQVDEWQATDVKDSIDKTWIMSGQSPSQRELLNEHKDTGRPVIVEGGARVWLRNKAVSYYVLKSDPDPSKGEEIGPENKDDVSNLKVPYFNTRISDPGVVARCKTVHEQDDGIIFAVCATGTSSKDSLLSWVIRVCTDDDVDDTDDGLRVYRSGYFNYTITQP